MDFQPRKRTRSDALVRAQVKYRLSHLEKVREITNRSCRKYMEQHRDEILAHKKLMYQWLSFVNNKSYKKEAETFRNILFEEI